MKQRIRMSPDTRRDSILKAAIKEAEKVGFDKVQRNAIAARANCSEGLVRHYFKTLPQLQRVIMGEALRVENARIIAQGIVAGHPRCKKLDDEVKRRVLASI